MSDDRIEIRIGEKRYDIVPPFTNRELHIIKQITGVRGGEIFEALESGDNDMLVAFAHIAVRRNNTARPSLDELWDLEAGAIAFEEVSDEVDPPTEEEEPVSGEPETHPSDSGSPSTDTSSTSPQAISAT